MGSDPRVVYPFVSSPLAPSEQATLERERVESSYEVSYERVSVVCAKEDRTKMEMEKRTDENFMIQSTLCVKCIKYDSIAED